MPVRIGVRERRVVDDLDAVERPVDEEQRRPRVRLRDDDVDRRHVAVGDEPLLAADDPAAVAPLGPRRDAGGVRPRALLGHRVGVVQLAAQRRPQPAVDLLRRARPEHVVRARDVPRQGVGRAPELLLDQHPLALAPALAAVLDRVQTAGETGGQRLGLDAGDVLGRQAPARHLGLLLQRDQDVVDERPRSLCRRQTGSASRTRRRARLKRWSCRTRFAALWPPRAITPPPGCVPAPHR